MKDLEIVLENKPGALAVMGEILGQHHISIEGGGVFNINEKYSIAHFLIASAEVENAKEVLASSGINMVKINEVIIQKLRQDVPGQLGLFCRKLASANVNIMAQYSDHSNQLVIVSDNYEMAKQISDEWKRGQW